MQTSFMRAIRNIDCLEWIFSRNSDCDCSNKQILSTAIFHKCILPIFDMLFSKKGISLLFFVAIEHSQNDTKTELQFFTEQLIIPLVALGTVTCCLQSQCKKQKAKICVSQRKRENKKKEKSPKVQTEQCFPTWKYLFKDLFSMACLHYKNTPDDFTYSKECKKKNRISP